ncbi:DUF1761 domain-containing protein [Jannaschia sp. W003]|uniref:DUF1761 domain-containing protein n=1 Tax=Jannaschia sp. W003 TaxID=2867012 RepID=UPI0021A7573C|nr:DUF1761 domain-containing protein [Jannaschia sp. W003]UWQ22555.1 DUF1761 domain-containing protein [Jannaschia sp. W003]
MPILSIFLAAVAAFGFGALWYSALAGRWMAVSGVPVVDGVPANRRDPLPYATSLLGNVAVALMLHLAFAAAGVSGPLSGLLWGLAAGAFVAAPWLLTCYGFAGRPRALAAIDAGYAVGGCGTIGLVLALL